MKHFVIRRIGVILTLISTAGPINSLFASVSTESLVMAFEGTGGEFIDFEDYAEGGILMSPVEFSHYDFWGHGWVTIDTYSHLIDTIRFELVAGGLFYLNSLDVTFGKGALYPEDELSYTDYWFEFSDGSVFEPAPTDGVVSLDDEFAHLPPLEWFTYSVGVPEEWRQDRPLTFVPANYWSSSLDNITLTPIPEPTTFAFLGLGSLALVMGRRRKQFSQQ